MSILSTTIPALEVLVGRRYLEALTASEPEVCAENYSMPSAQDLEEAKDAFELEIYFLTSIGVKHETLTIDKDGNPVSTLRDPELGDVVLVPRDAWIDFQSEGEPQEDRPSPGAARHSYDDRYYPNVVWTHDTPDRIFPKQERKFVDSMKIYSGALQKRIPAMVRYDILIQIEFFDDWMLNNVHQIDKYQNAVHEQTGQVLQFYKAAFYLFCHQSRKEWQFPNIFVGRPRGFNTPSMIQNMEGFKVEGWHETFQYYDSLAKYRYKLMSPYSKKQENLLWKSLARRTIVLRDRN